jgi:hypothetical protein
MEEIRIVKTKEEMNAEALRQAQSICDNIAALVLSTKTDPDVLEVWDEFKQRYESGEFNTAEDRKIYNSLSIFLGN